MNANFAKAALLKLIEAASSHCELVAGAMTPSTDPPMACLIEVSYYI